MFLYFSSTDEEKVKFRLARNKAFDQLEHGNSAKYLMLDEMNESKLLRIKAEFRDWYFGRKRFFKYNDEKVVLELNCVHAPDHKDLEYQNKVVKHFLGI